MRGRCECEHTCLCAHKYTCILIEEEIHLLKSKLGVGGSVPQKCKNRNFKTLTIMNMNGPLRFLDYNALYYQMRELAHFQMSSPFLYFWYHLGQG